jgi:hypothetical protein
MCDSYQEENTKWMKLNTFNITDEVFLQLRNRLLQEKTFHQDI